MKLSMLYETKPYSDMTPTERSHAKSYRAKTYKSDRKEKGRAASGSNETNKKTTPKWRKSHPKAYKAQNKVNDRVKSGELSPVKDGHARHHSSYDGEGGGEFKEVSIATNAKKANDKRSGEE